MPETQATVLIDINPILKPDVTGVGVYARELVRHLCSGAANGLRVGFYYNRNRRHHLQHLESAISSEGMRDGFSRGLGYNCGIDQEFGRLMSRWVDLQSWIQLRSRYWRVLHATNILLPPLPAKTRGIVTIHDLVFSRFPRFTSAYMQRRWTTRIKEALRRTECVIAISEATANDLQCYYGVPAKQIRVIYQGVDEDQITWLDASAQSALRRHWTLPERFLLFVGTLSVHKNVLTAIKAFLKINDPELGLVIVGKPGDSSAEITAFLNQCRERHRIRLYGYLDRQDLEAFYQLASVFLFPSLHEGFGLPVLEAMKRRLPVVTSNNSSLAELFHDSAVLVNASDPDEIAKAVEKLLCDDHLRANLIAKGEQKARTLTWARTAQQTRELYLSLL